MKTLLVALLFTVCSASAQEWHPFASVDYLGVGNLKTHASSDVQNICNAAIAAGATTCSASEQVGGAVGGRVGAYFPFGTMQIGPSFGYLDGGPGSSKNSLTVTPAGSINGTENDDTFRFLLQGKTKIAGDAHLHVTFDGGLGLAVIKQNIACSDGGSLAGACAGIAPATLGWATWELGPSLWVERFQFALHYVGFARGGANLPWNTVGLSLGVEL